MHYLALEILNKFRPALHIPMVLTMLSQVHAATPVCERTVIEQHGAVRTIKVGDIWTGTRTRPAAARLEDGRLLVAYYDAGRWVTLASVDSKSGDVCRLRLPSRFDGWDAHNDLVMALAPDGSVHLAGNAHASRLFYARGEAKNLSSVTVTPMTGHDEDQATYPTFLRSAGGGLLFFYRTGRSGAGTWLTNRWEQGQWHRIGSAFAGADQHASVSAYPSNVITDARGTSHMAVVWRRTPDVASNFAVGYAQTRDFRHWSGLFTPSALGPVRPEQIDTVDQPGEGAGLVNNVQLMLAPDGKPVLIYARYGKAGMDAIVAARPDGAGWMHREIAVSEHRSVVAGGGAMQGLPSISTADEHSHGLVDIYFPPNDRRRLDLNLTTLEVRAVERTVQHSEPAAAPSIPIPPGLAHAARLGVTVRASGFDGPTEGRLLWFAQAPNHDRPLECTTETPQACAPPPSPLLWIVEDVSR